MDAGHLAARFASSASRHADLPATRVAAGEGWTVRTYRELAADVRRLAARLTELGLEPDRRVRALARSGAPPGDVRPRPALCTCALSSPPPRRRASRVGRRGGMPTRRTWQRGVLHPWRSPFPSCYLQLTSP